MADSSMARYNCSRASSSSSSRIPFLPTSAKMIYLSQEGSKVATPNENRLEAEIKNRSEVVKLDFYKKQLEKEVLRGEFLNKMEKKQVIHALKVRWIIY